MSSAAGRETSPGQLWNSPVENAIIEMHSGNTLAESSGKRKRVFLLRSLPRRKREGTRNGEQPEMREKLASGKSHLNVSEFSYNFLTALA